MKLHRLDLFNLNSLYGKQAIDFDKDLAGANLFLIHGRTGSGKSTLMDAISLALFGKTPRLNDQRGTPDADPASAMSRGTGECGSTLEFSRLGPDGRRIRYRASWAVRRANRNPTKKLQPVERCLEQLASDGSWQVLTAGKKKALIDAAFNEALEGFTAEDFERSMLLAQGGFDKLLSATPKERALILERLTDTREYKRLGDYAAQLASAHRRNIDYFSRQLSTATPVSEEEIGAAEERVTQSKKLLADGYRQLEIEKKSLKWWTDHSVFLEQLRAIENERSLLNIETTKLAPLLRQLEQHDAHLAAFEALDDLDRWTISQQELKSLLLTKIDQQTKSGLEARALASENEKAQLRLNQADELIAQLTEPCLALKKLFSEGKSERLALERLFERCRDTETNVRNKEEQLAHALSALNSSTQKLDEHKVVLDSHQGVLTLRDAWNERLREQCVRLRADEEQVVLRREELGKVSQDLALKRETLEEEELAHREKAQAQLLQPESEANQAREHLEAFCQIEESDKQLLFLRKTESEAQQLLAESRLAEQALNTHQLLKEELNAAKNELNQSERAAQAALVQARELLTTKKHASERKIDAENHLQQLVLVSEIAARRAALKDGEACPLCGSAQHPYTESPESCPDEDKMRRAHAAAASEFDERKIDFKAVEEQAQKAESKAAVLRSKKESAVHKTRSVELRLSNSDENLHHLLVSAQLTPTSEMSSCKRVLLARTEKQASLREEIRLLELASQRYLLAEQDLLKINTEIDQRHIKLTNRSIALNEKMESLKRNESQLALNHKALLTKKSELGSLLDQWDISTSESSTEHEDTSVSDWEREVNQRIAALEAIENLVTREISERQEKESAHKIAMESHRVELAVAQELKKQVDERKKSLDERREEAKKQKERVLAIWSARGVHVLAQEDGKLATNPGELLQQLEGEKVYLTKTWTHTSSLAAQAQNTQKELDGEIKSLRSQSEEGEKKRQLSQTTLETIVAQLECGPIEELRKFRMSTEMHQKAREAETSLLERKLTQQTLEQERTQALARHEKHMPITLSPAKIGKGQEDWEDWGRQLGNVVLHAETQLALAIEEEKTQQITWSDLKRRQAEREKSNTDLKRASEQARIWQSLDKLIGTDKGNAFRQFAQGLNLHRLIVSANHHLRHLSDRFQLTQARHDGIPSLEFAIVDLFQVGEPRAVRTLSGGERFLVSLALALGLSDLRSQSLPIETLLLDEGFGTLDPETLQVALSALERLQASGRQIGIISHVAGLKERIEAQVHIVEEGAGRSHVVVVPPLT